MEVGNAKGDESLKMLHLLLLASAVASSSLFIVVCSSLVPSLLSLLCTNSAAWTCCSFPALVDGSLLSRCDERRRRDDAHIPLLAEKKRRMADNRATLARRLQRCFILLQIISLLLFSAVAFYHTPYGRYAASQLIVRCSLASHKNLRIADYKM